MWLALASIAVLIGAALMISLRADRVQGAFSRRGGMLTKREPGGDSGPSPAAATGGTLTVTGVSERPATADKNGEMYCTLSGTILGPDTPPTEVYGTYVVPQTYPWPQIGDTLPVSYRPGKVDSTWRVAPPA